MRSSNTASARIVAVFSAATASWNSGLGGGRGSGLLRDGILQDAHHLGRLPRHTVEDHGGGDVLLHPRDGQAVAIVTVRLAGLGHDFSPLNEGPPAGAKCPDVVPHDPWPGRASLFRERKFTHLEGAAQSTESLGFSSEVTPVEGRKAALRARAGPLRPRATPDRVRAAPSDFGRRRFEFGRRFSRIGQRRFDFGRRLPISDRAGSMSGSASTTSGSASRGRSLTPSARRDPASRRRPAPPRARGTA